MPRTLGPSLLVVLLLAQGARAAAPETLAAVDGNVPIAAGGGWVVWSAPVDGGWGLTAWRGGVTAALPVRPRHQPFDLDVGSDRHGRAIVTFSRCRHTDFLSSINHQTGGGRGCRLRAVDLVTGRERGLRIPHPRKASDTSPSAWLGRVAFARSRPGGSFARVMLWEDGRLRTLAGGRRPTCRPGEPCEEYGPYGGVDSVDLGRRWVTFLWWMAGGDTTATGGGYEIRADRVDGRRARRLATGFAGEVCGGSADAELPIAPQVDGPAVSWLTMTTSCYVVDAGESRAVLPGRRVRTRHLSGQLLQYARDGGTRYALMSTVDPHGEPPPCRPCYVVRLP